MITSRVINKSLRVVWPASHIYNKVTIVNAILTLIK